MANLHHHRLDNLNAANYSVCFTLDTCPKSIISHTKKLPQGLNLVQGGRDPNWRLKEIFQGRLVVLCHLGSPLLCGLAAPLFIAVMLALLDANSQGVFLFFLDQFIDSFNPTNSKKLLAPFFTQRKSLKPREPSMKLSQREMPTI